MGEMCHSGRELRIYNEVLALPHVAARERQVKKIFLISAAAALLSSGAFAQ